MTRLRNSLTEYDVTEAMLLYGGSFVQALAKLIRQADEGNKQRLVAAFPEYLAKYREVALHRLSNPDAAPRPGARDEEV